ncbi:DEAD/DEAH box helicase [Actinokineospora iranica]|uniref:DEAD/DEAH box helicase n=1 Tax=Actinokineospora iranica TaxID=1271860 RepID=UPI000B887915|nr:DEAD/DEAH box helicase [Actinokineospora iranica]
MARSFDELGVPASLVAALAEAGVTAPFPIQAATLPDSLAGRDVLGRGRTGSGKTYAFLIPLLARLVQGAGRRAPGRPRALILAPTRELATQIHDAAAPLAKALGLRATTVFGGVRPGPQVTALQAGVDLLVACPGRLEDHMKSGHVRLDAVETTVLDEADHMADLGFLPVVRRLLDQTPRTGQRLLFSATLDGGIDVLVRRYLVDPVTHSVDSAQSPVAAMTHHVLHVGGDARLPVLVDLTSAPGRCMVFTRTRRGATRLTRQLVAAGVRAVELHGDLGQQARTRNLLAFSDGSAPTLVATDIAARGIHVDDVALVIHADPPVEHKAYLHRSGRTARAGASGTVVTLMTDEQVADVRDLTRKAGITPITTKARPGHPVLTELAPGERVLVTPPVRPATEPRPARGQGRGKSTGRAGAKAEGKRTSSASHTSASRTAAAAPRGSAASAPRAAAASAAEPTRGAAAFSAGSSAGRRRR